MIQSQASPLLYAAKMGNASTVECLIKCGADVNAVNEVSQCVCNCMVQHKG